MSDNLTDVQRLVLTELQKGETRHSAAAIVDVPYNLISYWLSSNPEFKRQFNAIAAVSGSQLRVAGKRGPRKETLRLMSIVLDVVRDGGTLTYAAEVVGRHISQLSYWKRAYPEYAAQLATAQRERLMLHPPDTLSVPWETLVTDANGKVLHDERPGE